MRPLRIAWLFTAVIVSMALVLVTGAGCMSDPNPVGVGLLPSSDFLKIDTTALFAQSSYLQQAIPSPSFTRLLVGKTGSIEAWGLMRFLPLPDTLKGVQVLDAKVELRTEYHFGDSLAPLSFSIHKVLQYWRGDSLTIDSLVAPGFFQSNAVGSFSQSSIGDTSGVSFRLDTAVVRSWLDSAGDTVLTNHGILLRPSNSKVVKGFATFGTATDAFRPKLVVVYTRQSGTRSDTVRFSLGNARFVTKVAGPAATTDSVLLAIQSGVVTRGMLGFSVSSLPPKSPIHQAILEVKLDNARSRMNSYTPDSLTVYFVAKDGIVFPSRILGETIRDGSNTTYKFQINHFVQQWVRDPQYTSVAIGGFQETGFLDLFAIHGSAALPTLRPKLTVIYSPVQ